MYISGRQGLEFKEEKYTRAKLVGGEQARFWVGRLKHDERTFMGREAGSRLLPPVLYLPF